MTYTFPTKEDLDNVDLSWKRYLLPKMHREGVKILVCEILLFSQLTLWLGWFVCWPLGIAIAVVSMLLLVFSFYFFRNPVRVSPKDDSLILAPADGIVSNIKEMVPPPELGLGTEKRIRVSIFMSVFSVHVNRSPVAGKVVALKYVKGKFVSVQDKDSDDNERQLIGIEQANGTRIGVVQIAGLVARRIYCPLKLGDTLEMGGVFGMIRFGSRLDVFLPPGVEPTILLGQVAIAGESVLAKM